MYYLYQGRNSNCSRTQKWALLSVYYIDLNTPRTDEKCGFDHSLFLLLDFGRRFVQVQSIVHVTFGK